METSFRWDGLASWFLKNCIADFLEIGPKLTCLDLLLHIFYKLEESKLVFSCNDLHRSNQDYYDGHYIFPS
jgi:hypothetical protein